MEIKCKKTPTTGIQIFIDEEFLTSFSYSPESDEIIELLESASENKIKINQLESRIKELEEKCKSEYQRGIEDGKIIAEHGTTMYQE